MNKLDPIKKKKISDFKNKAQIERAKINSKINAKKSFKQNQVASLKKKYIAKNPDLTATFENVINADVYLDAANSILTNLNNLIANADILFDRNLPSDVQVSFEYLFAISKVDKQKDLHELLKEIAKSHKVMTDTSVTHDVYVYFGSEPISNEDVEKYLPGLKAECSLDDSEFLSRALPKYRDLFPAQIQIPNQFICPTQPYGQPNQFAPNLQQTQFVTQNLPQQTQYTTQNHPQQTQYTTQNLPQTSQNLQQAPVFTPQNLSQPPVFTPQGMSQPPQFNPQSPQSTTQTLPQVPQFTPQNMSQPPVFTPQDMSQPPQFNPQSPQNTTQTLPQAPQFTPQNMTQPPQFTPQTTQTLPQPPQYTQQNVQPQQQQQPQFTPQTTQTQTLPQPSQAPPFQPPPYAPPPSAAQSNQLNDVADNMDYPSIPTFLQPKVEEEEEEK